MFVTLRTLVYPSKTANAIRQDVGQSLKDLFHPGTASDLPWLDELKLSFAEKKRNKHSDTAVTFFWWKRLKRLSGPN